jgi:hypothetical protein
MKYNLEKVIYKFTILFSVQYLINLVWIYYFHSLTIEMMVESQSRYVEFASYFSRAITIIFNVTYTILVYAELKKHELKSIIILLITLFFGFIGVSMFLLLLIYNLYIKKVETHGGNIKLE